MKKTLSIILSLILTFTFASCGVESNTQTGLSEIEEGKTMLVQYPTYPDELPRNYDYEVSVTQGDKTINLPVYNASRHKNSYFSVKDTDSYRRFCEFGFKGEVTVCVKVKGQMSNYVILPTSKGIKSQYKDGVITFKLDNPQNIAIRLNDDQNTILSIFAEEIETDVPKETDPFLIYFKSGLNNVSKHCDVKFSLTEYGEFIIPLGYRVYLEPGALVTAKLESETGNGNVKIYGRGAFIDSRLDRVADGALANMLFMNSNSNVTIKDVKFLDAHCFNLCFTRVNNAEIKNVKLLSSEISTDGITFWGHESVKAGDNSNVLIDGCYMYINDNVFVMASANGISVKNCTIGTRCAIVFPQGQLNDFSMENCDIFEMGNLLAGRINMRNEGQFDPTWNIKLKNIRAEDSMNTNALCWVDNQGDGKKQISLENVSLPPVYDTTIKAKANKNVFINLKNVSISEFPILIKNQISLNSSEAEIDIDGLPNPKKAGTGNFKKSIQYVEHDSDPTIKVGSYIVPYDQKGALEVEGYLPADNLLKALPYNEDVSAHVKEIDGVRMLPHSFFKDVLKITLVTDKNGVNLLPYETSGNLLKNGGFENISHKHFETDFINSTDWTCFNFAGLFKEKEIVRNGESAVRVAHKKQSGEKGLAQFISPIIQQYGAGTYTFEAYVRLQEDSQSTNEIFLGLAQSNWELKSERKDVGTFKITDEWTKITHTVTITDPTLYGYDHAFFFVGASVKEKCLEIFVDDAALYFSK